MRCTRFQFASRGRHDLQDPLPNGWKNAKLYVPQNAKGYISPMHTYYLGFMGLRDGLWCRFWHADGWEPISIIPS